MKIKKITKIISFILFIIILIRNFYKIYLKKYSKIQANNLIFKDRNWNCYQYIETNLITDKYDFETIKSRIINNLLKWSFNQRWFKNDKINGTIKSTNICLKNYIQKLLTKPAPLINNYNIPFYLVFINKSHQLICFLSHYYFDGQIFIDFMNCISNNNQTINFLPYKYKPILSDIRLLNYLVKNTITMINYKSKLKIDYDKSLIITKRVNLISSKLHRYKIMAIIFETVFKYIDCNKIKVAFTLGIKDEDSYYNRIGIIVKSISRKDNLKDYEEMFKKKFNNSVLIEGLTSYDLVRNFPVHLLRNNLNTSIDIVCTSFRYFNSTTTDNDYCQWNLSSFIGLGKIPIYINTVTCKEELLISLKISTQNFNYKLFLENESNSKLHHKFNKKNNYYKTKYNKLLYKYKKLTS